jgi:transposase
MINTTCLAQENHSLKQQVALQQSHLAELQSSITQQQTRIRALEELLAALKQRHFGASSEKISADQLALFNEADTEIEVETETTRIIPVSAHQRRSHRRISIPVELPREEIIHDLPADQKICPHDGTPLKQMGFESYEQLDIIPAQIKVLRHLRLKYTCPCCEQHIVTAPKPAQPIEKSIASPGLLSFVATQKYVDALPLYRQTEIFSRIGIELDRTTLANWAGLTS